MIDINCDMGEGFGIYRIGLDEEIMPFITSANLACGFHAADPVTMTKTVRLAAQHGVSVGAHPSFPDLVGFGRRKLSATHQEIRADVIYQTGALNALCISEGVTLRHVKLHGALYSMAGTDFDLALVIAEAIRDIDSSLIMICPSHSEMTRAAREAGIHCREEVFADRAYTASGTLVPRHLPGAVIGDVEAVVERVLVMVRKNTVVSIEGVPVPVQADTVCVHSDTPGAVSMVRAIRNALDAEILH